MDDIKKLMKEYQKHNLSWEVEMNMLIARAATAHATHYNKQHYKYKMTHPSSSILYALLEKGGKMTQKQIANRLPVTKQAITSALSVLEKRGFVAREIHPNDRRKRWVMLTQAGVDFIRISMPLRAAFYDRFSTSISEKEGEIIIAALSRLLKFYEKEINKVKRSRKKKVDC
jgi:DNA-binding MarR family transcriptional regulator